MIEVETKGVCAKKIIFDVEDDKIKSVKFIGGCAGNAGGLSSLLVGYEVKNAVERLDGITCGHRSTSCPDQLAQALKTSLKG